MEEEVEVQDELMDLSIVKKELAGDASTLEDSVDDERESLEELHPLDAVEAELAIKEEDDVCRDLSFDENVEKYMETSTSGGAMRCCFCNRGFRHKFMLKRHLSIHMDNRPSFSCEFCGNSYTWIDSLRRHSQKCKKNAHTVAQYRCTTCWRNFNQEIYLIEHQKDCSGQRGTLSNSLNINTTPDDAHDETTAFADVAGDAASRNDGKLDLFECGICYKKFKNKDFFEKHQGIHTLLQTPHNCNTCGNTYKYRGSLVRHQLMCEIMEEPTIPYTCPNCGNTFNQVLTLTQHRKVCGQQPKSQKQLEEGPSKPPDVEENTTKGVNEEKMIPSDVKKATRRVFSCQICGNTYRHSHSMKRHQRMCKEMGDTAKFSCSICGNKFHERISMIQHWRVCRGHVKKVSGIVKQKPGVKMIRIRTRKVGLFPCGICGRTYTWESNLRRHQKTCTKDVKPPEKPMENLLRFSCQKCGSMFNEQSMLDTHAKICSSNVPMDVMKEPNEDFAVITATKTATTALNARVEEQRPRLKKQILYSCRICGNAYKHRGSRFRHQKECELKAGKQQLTCLTCGNKFRDVSALEVHRNSCRAVTKNPQKPDVLTGSENQGEKRLKPSRKEYFRVKISGKIYAWKFTLQRHQRKCCKNDATSRQTLPKLSPKKEDRKEAILSVKSEIEASTATTEDQLKQEESQRTPLQLHHHQGIHAKIVEMSTNTAQGKVEAAPTLSCTKCGNEFHEEASFVEHVKICGEQAEQVLESSSNVQKPAKKDEKSKKDDQMEASSEIENQKNLSETLSMSPQYVCIICENNFNGKISFDAHIDECRKLFWDTKDDSSEESDEQPDPPEEIKIFECSICSMSFKSKTDMMDHAVTHMKNKPRHTCKLCDNTYAWKRNLLKHMEQ
uniref:C2H2-type domain-containing protein n=1 Tax=Lutzomyia longipalpis TaxID=7200 RepID=A0A1B0C949_LUTLO